MPRCFTPLASFFGYIICCSTRYKFLFIFNLLYYSYTHLMLSIASQLPWCLGRLEADTARTWIGSSVRSYLVMDSNSTFRAEREGGGCEGVRRVIWVASSLVRYDGRGGAHSTHAGVFCIPTESSIGMEARGWGGSRRFFLRLVATFFIEAVMRNCHPAPILQLERGQIVVILQEKHGKLHR